jgi:Zn-dependent protease with chaperone function
MVEVPEPTEQALAYYFVRNVVWFANLAFNLAVPALFLFAGWSARIRDSAQRVSSRWAVVVLLYVVIYSVITWVIGLPLQYYDEFAVEHQFGLSNQTFAKWATDAVIGLAVTTVITAVVTLGIWRLLKRSPRRWWLYSGLAAIPFTVFMFLVAPIWISPLFNKFGPMQDKALEAKILALADRAGIEGSRVFEVDKSVDTKTTNAYVTGVLDTKRIVLWDTIIKKLDERQLLFVMAHEMGHYALHHVWQFVVLVCALVMLALYAAQRLCHGLIDRYRARFGFDRLEDIASFPLVTMVASVVFLVTAPAFNAFSRHAEHEADRFALEITRDNEAGAKAFVSLQRDNLAIPRPNAFLHWLRGSHPTLAERIEFSNTYRPWEKGEALRYGDRFKPQ